MHTQMQVQSLSERSPEEAVATYSSILVMENSHDRGAWGLQTTKAKESVN